MNTVNQKSSRITGKLRPWQDIYASKSSGKILKGILSGTELYVTDKQRPVICAIVLYHDIKVYIPSQRMSIESNEFRDTEEVISYRNYEKSKTHRILQSMIGAEIEFIITEINYNKKLVSASRTAAMNARKVLSLSKHKVGDTINVKVVQINRSSIIVEAYGIESNVLTSDISWDYINEITDYVEIGDKVPAVIKEMDIKNNTIKVSLKEATNDPFNENIVNFIKGGEYLGTVTGIENYGVYIKLASGVYALCPNPKWSRFVPSVNDQYLVKIKSIDKTNQKIDGNLSRQIKKAQI